MKNRVHISKKMILLFVLSFTSFFSYCQIKPNSFEKWIKINYYHIDTTNIEIKSIINVWKSYIINRIYGYAKKNDTLGSKYWNEEEKKISTNSDHVFSIWPDLVFNQNYILTLEPNGNGFYKIFNCNIECDSLENLTMKAVYYVLIKKIGNNYKLFNYFYTEKDKMRTTDMGNIKYYYPNYYKFSKKEARKLIQFEDSLSILFALPIQQKMTYILDTNNSSLVKHLGFCYLQNYNNNGKAGQFIKNQGIILSSFSENDRHELVHTFTERKYPDKLKFFDEGLAQYLGGDNSGYNWNYQMTELYKHLCMANLDSIDFMNLPVYYYGTNPSYVFGYAVIKYTVENFNIEKALNLLTYSRRQYTPKMVIDKELGIPKENLNLFLLNCLKNYLKQVN